MSHAADGTGERDGANGTLPHLSLSTKGANGTLPHLSLSTKFALSITGNFISPSLDVSGSAPRLGDIIADGRVPTAVLFQTRTPTPG